MWGSTTGIDATYSTITGNTVYANTTGLSMYGSTFENNRSYDNALGAYSGGASMFRNNVLWDNTNGIVANGNYAADDTNGFVNNTIQQTGGKAFEVSPAARPTCASSTTSSPAPAARSTS